MKRLIIAMVLLSTVLVASGQNYRSRLESTRIPSLSITNATLDEAVNIIIEACGLANSGNWAPGVIINAERPGQRVTIVAQNLTGLKAFELLAESGNLDLVVEDHSVVLTGRK